MRNSVRRLAGALTVATGIGLLVAAAASWPAGRQPPGAFGITSMADSSRTVDSVDTMTTTRSAPGAPVPVAPSTVAPSAVAAGPPVTLAIPSERVLAGVVPVVDVGGVLQVPDDPAQVGWWNASAPAGSVRGSVVIDGHVDSAASGPGALFRLTGLRMSDRIVLSTATGARHSYAVIGRRVYRKTAGLPSGIFDSAGAPRLVLISCGGPFDSVAGSYLDNIVVFAAPV